MKGVSICVLKEAMPPYLRMRSSLFIVTPDTTVQKKISVGWKELKLGNGGRECFVARLNSVDSKSMSCSDGKCQGKSE